MRTVPLVETTRGLVPGQGHTENVHQGVVAVVDLEGRVVWSAGDPGALCFTRSTLKPLQALPFLQSNGPARLGFGPNELALLCASHSAEPKHLDRVEHILAAAGCGESDLACGSHVPLHYASRSEHPPEGACWNQLHNNCSGKHAGFLAWCSLHGVPKEGYLHYHHPLQVEIRKAVLHTTGQDAESLGAGLDGCSAPNYVLPLAALAHFYARLAQGERDPQCGDVFAPLFDAMTGRPDLVSGEGRSDLAYMASAPGDWISKAGADGLQVLASRRAGLGIAIKLADGNALALQVAFVEVLDQLGLLRDRPYPLLAPWRGVTLRNRRGIETGVMRPVVRLVEGPGT